MKAKLIMIVLLGIFAAILAVWLIFSGKLIIFDVCEEKAKDIVPKSEMIKMTPVTDEELKNFPNELKSNYMPTVYYHEVLRCRMRNDSSPYLRW